MWTLCASKGVLCEKLETRCAQVGQSSFFPRSFPLRASAQRAPPNCFHVALREARGLRCKNTIMLMRARLRESKTNPRPPPHPLPQRGGGAEQRRDILARHVQRRAVRLRSHAHLLDAYMPAAVRCGAARRGAHLCQRCEGSKAVEPGARERARVSVAPEPNEPVTRSRVTNSSSCCCCSYCRHNASVYGD